MLLGTRMSNSRLILSLLFRFILIIQLLSRVSAIRKDPNLLEKRICRTTVQGRYLRTDDNGHVCDALSMDPQSGCCFGKREQFSCHGCNLISQCCNSYEFCVSCCLNPARTQKELALKVKMAKPVSAGAYASVFDFCTGRCRHNSESVVHENAYLSDFHHCFSLPSNSTGVSRYIMAEMLFHVTHMILSSMRGLCQRWYVLHKEVLGNAVPLPSGGVDRNPELRLNGIHVVVGRQGESCDSVCKSNGQSCVPSKLSVLNQCEIMQKYMSCKGACLASIGADQPAEVVDDAPRHLNPGACLYTRTQTILSCDGSHQHTRRLCPCA
ncbi:uncharacterized protein LOC117914595 isoform X1 [Vitis riparia]|uniref:uncharacterized protein LOC117914595 isoform X1 n=1 Tax=Vitis riparia TaxID=96939 RepID=UPI00155A9473|nr:uncharacterized protein LOC117914595 isoform X1 [Vitis riparia]